MDPAPYSQTLELALCQTNAIVGDLVGNTDTIIDLGRSAQADGARVALFPELAISGYPPEDLVLREDFLAACEAQLLRIAAAALDVVILVGYPQAHANGVSNSLAAVRGGRVEVIYQKRLLPNYGVFDERRYFTSGAETSVLDLDGIFAGLTVCEDIWFERPVLSELHAAGAQIVFNASASPYHAGKPGERESMLRDRAAGLGVPIVYCNLVGGQDELVFDGGSMIIDCDGEVLARAPRFETATLRHSLRFHWKK